MSLIKLSGTALAGLLCVATIQAEPKPNARILTASERQTALTDIKKVFQERYVFPEMRPAIIERLDQQQRAGRYDTDDPIAFAERITEDLRDVSHDKHLSLTLDPKEYAARLAPPKSDEGEEASFRRQAIRDHYGLSEMKILPGNVRYLKIAGFEWVRDETGAAYDDAMRFLKDGDAVVIDIRGNGGGSHAAVRYLVSHFLPEDKLLLTFYAGSETPVQSHTVEYLPAGRLIGKPLYVLIDNGVASAGEDFAYTVEQFRVGELVGSKTVGAANNNDLLPIAPGFILSVSFGRPVHPVSKGNWEGVGINPTVEVRPSQALEVAQSLALKRLTENPGVSPESLAEYTWARIAIDAKLYPVTISSERLSALAGRYGDIAVDFRDGALWLSRPNRPTAPLSPLTADGLFAIDGVERLRVRLTGQKLELLLRGQPAPRVFARNNAARG